MENNNSAVQKEYRMNQFLVPQSFFFLHLCKQFLGIPSSAVNILFFPVWQNIFDQGFVFIPSIILYNIVKSYAFAINWICLLLACSHE